MLELYGAGATDYVTESGGVRADDAGFYYAPIAALRDLPEGLGMRQAQAETLALAPADAEWVLVYPNDFSEVPQPGRSVRCGSALWLSRPSSRWTSG